MSPRPDPEAAVALGFDPEAVLERDSRILLDPAFLETLHRELADEASPQEAARTLLQMGFLHGLQDAIRVLASPPRTPSSSVFAPPLRMPCRTEISPSGTLDLHGSWPDRWEAEAQLSSLGSGVAAACHLSAGYTSGWLSGAFDADLLAVETTCCAAGDATCSFVAREAETWRSSGDAEAQRMLALLPFGRFRALVRERVARESRGGGGDRSAARGGVDRQAAAVHVWGPVMVMPWSGPEATLHTLELLARDRGAAEVSVIVIDMQGAVIDESYGALAVEQVIQTSDSWGTEVLLVDPSPLCDAVLADLEPQPLLVLKDLEPAVALAFQIARSQRRAV